MKRIALLMIIMLTLWGCASTSGSAHVENPKKDLTANGVIKRNMTVIDLSKWNIVCRGQSKAILDTIEGVTVKGIACFEDKYVSFVYFFNGQPFFLAITGISEDGSNLKPLAGYGALRDGRYMNKTDLAGPPKLPAWAYGPDGTIKENIYPDDLNTPVEP